MYKKIKKYFVANPLYNSAVYAILGIGIGILIASPFANPHPVRWGIALLALGALGHFYAWASK